MIQLIKIIRVTLPLHAGIAIQSTAWRKKAHFLILKMRLGWVRTGVRLHSSRTKNAMFAKDMN